MVGSKYLYLEDLLKLEAMATGMGQGVFRPGSQLGRKLSPPTPIRVLPDTSSRALAGGFISEQTAIELRGNHSNMPSVQQRPHLVEAHIKAEVEAGHLLGPLPPHLARIAQTSPIGLIPKAHQPGKWKLIVDLSSPAGHSINDGIAPDLCHMQYASVLDAVRMIQSLGVGTQLAKLDLHNAYSMVPVHPDDHPLLGIQWDQDVFIDTALPFGLRSAPNIFSALADALAWIGVTRQLHYLDHFLLVGPPDSAACAQALQRTLEVCLDLGVS